jgi:hypothetical protein
LENDDPEAAIRTAERVQHPRSKAMCWQRISDHSRKQRNLVAAKYSARQAAQLLLINDFRPFIARDMARVAATVAQAGEVELAKQVFERAIAFSNANDDPKFDHHWIARMQVSGGLLTDAYGTIQAITDANDRALPLAQLARAVAKAEFEASKKNKK